MSGDELGGASDKISHPRDEKKRFFSPSQLLVVDWLGEEEDGCLSMPRRIAVLISLSLSLQSHRLGYTPLDISKVSLTARTLSLMRR
jgi:hypothetical protein